MAAPRSAVRRSQPPFNRNESSAIARKNAALELACLIALIETIMWAAPFMPDHRAVYAGLSFLIIVLLVTCHLRDHLKAREIGFRLDNFLGVFRRLALPLAFFILLVFAIGGLSGNLRFGAKFYSMLATVPLWALVQQYMLLVFAGRRLRIIFGEGRGSAILTAALFSLLHLPNPVLVVACAAGGYVWASEYKRSPNLLANALTQAIASAFLANTLPGWLLKNMVVGYNYFLR